MSDDKMPHDSRMKLALVRRTRSFEFSGAHSWGAFELVWYDPSMCFASQTVAAAPTKEAAEAAARLYGRPFKDITR